MRANISTRNAAIHGLNLKGVDGEPVVGRHKDDEWQFSASRFANGIEAIQTGDADIEQQQIDRPRQ